MDETDDGSDEADGSCDVGAEHVVVVIVVVMDVIVVCVVIVDVTELGAAGYVGAGAATVVIAPVC